MPKCKVDEGQLERMMNVLELSRDEALVLMESDREVDRMSTKQAESDLTDTQREISKKMCKTGTRQVKPKMETPAEDKPKGKGPTAYKWDKRERKPDEEKEMLIAGLAQFMESFDPEKLEITNKTQKVVMIFNGTQYTVTLTRNKTHTI